MTLSSCAAQPEANENYAVAAGVSERETETGKERSRRESSPFQ